MLKLTREQREALARVYARKHPVPEVGVSDWLRGYRAFRRTVQPGPGCIMVRWAGIWLGIEPDGYTHS